MTTAEEFKKACEPLEFEFTVSPEFISWLKQQGDKITADFKNQYPKMWEHLQERFPHLSDL